MVPIAGNCCHLYRKHTIWRVELQCGGGKNTKDSVFLDLFGQKEYLLQLYHVLHPEDVDIIWEYTAFTKIFDQCVRELGRTAKTASRVLEVCQEKKILAGYLKEREEEVKRTMLAIFEQEEVEAIDRRNFRKEVTAANKEEMKKCVIKMAKAGELSVNNLSVFFPQFSPSDIEEIKREVKPQE